MTLLPIDESTGKRTIRIDASSLVKADCRKAFYFTVVDGLRSAGKIPARMHIGSAAHIFAEEFYVSGFNKACDKAREYFLATEFQPDYKAKNIGLPLLMEICASLGAYLTASPFQPLMVADKPLVEIRFNIPVYEDNLFRIELCGTMDKLGKFKNGCYAIADYKFSSAVDTDSFFQNYVMSTQFMTYLWALRWHRQNVGGIFEEIASGPIGIFIEGVFYGSAHKDIDIVRGDVTYPDDAKLEEFELGIRRTCAELISIVKNSPENYLPMDGLSNGACSSFGRKCFFLPICGAINAEHSQLVKDQLYRTEYYNPLAFRD